MITTVLQRIQSQMEFKLQILEPRGVSAQTLTNARVTNYLSLISAGICFPFVFLYLYWGHKSQALFVAFGIVMLILPIYFNSKSRVRLARSWYVIFSNIFIFILADIFGRDAGIQWCFFATACLSYVIYHRHERFQRTLSALLPMICYFILEGLNYDIFFEISFLEIHKQIISKGIVITVFLLLITSLSQKHKANDEITEKLESDLDLSNLKFEAIYENAPIMISAFSTNGEALLWNKACCEHLGYEFSEIASRNNAIETMFESDEEKRNAAQDYLQAKREFIEYKLKTKTGETVHHMWAHFQLSSQLKLSVGYDVSELKKTREELRLANEDLERKVLERTQQLEKTTQMLVRMGDVIEEVFWVRNGTTGKFEYISHASEKIWGIKHEEIFDDPSRLHAMILPEDFKRLEEKLNECLQSKASRFDFEYRLKKKGEIRWIWVRCFSEVDQSGKTQRIFGVSTDITAMKQTQDMLEAQKVQMISSSRMATLGELSSGVAHEINNPLSIILVKANQIGQFAESKNTDFEALYKHAQKVKSTAERIVKIVKSLRLFSREGSHDPFTTNSLKQIVDDTWELCQANLDDDNTKFEIQSVDPEWKIECRPVQVAQVLLNLLMNSIDAVKTLNAPWVKLAIQDHNGHYEIAVTDSGQGIPESLREKIMQPFFTTKEAGRGTGLGLSLSTDIIEKHGGKLFLDQSNANTCFRVILPKRQTQPLIREKKTG